MPVTSVARLYPVGDRSFSAERSGTFPGLGAILFYFILQPDKVPELLQYGLDDELEQLGLVLHFAEIMEREHRSRHIRVTTGIPHLPECFRQCIADM